MAPLRADNSRSIPSPPIRGNINPPFNAPAGETTWICEQPNGPGPRCEIDAPL